MATLFVRRPILTTLAASSALASIYYVSTTRQQLRLDSPRDAPTFTLSFPKNMLFSKQLRVTDVQQVNHDTKRIVFALPGGTNEVSGVTPGGTCITRSYACA
jgi:cytochrome-b5 reductase